MHPSDGELYGILESLLRNGGSTSSDDSSNARSQKLSQLIKKVITNLLSDPTEPRYRRVKFVGGALERAVIRADESAEENETQVRLLRELFIALLFTDEGSDFVFYERSLPQQRFERALHFILQQERRFARHDNVVEATSVATDDTGIIGKDMPPAPAEPSEPTEQSILEGERLVELRELRKQQWKVSHGESRGSRSWIPRMFRGGSGEVQPQRDSVDNEGDIGQVSTSSFRVSADELNRQSNDHGRPQMKTVKDIKPANIPGGG